MAHWLTSCDRKQSVTHIGTKSHPQQPHTVGFFLLLQHSDRKHPVHSDQGHFSMLLFLLVCVCSLRSHGPRWSTAWHAAATGGLGGLGLCPTPGSSRPWAARSHAGQDRAKRCPHEAQQPASAQADASVPNDGQWWGDNLGKIYKTLFSHVKPAN